jgi:hypothetical protein
MQNLVAMEYIFTPKSKILLIVEVSYSPFYFTAKEPGLTEVDQSTKIVKYREQRGNL